MGGNGGIPPGSWRRIDTNEASVAIAADEGNLYQLHNTGHVFRYLGMPDQWEPMDTSSLGARIAPVGNLVVGSAQLFEQHSRGYIYRYDLPLDVV
jgi:hypothetical protein